VYFSDYSQDVYLIPSQGALRRESPSTPKPFGVGLHGHQMPRPSYLNRRVEGSPELWRVPASGGQPERQSAAANATGGVALDSERRRLAYVVRNGGVHIGAFSLSSRESPHGASPSPRGPRPARPFHRTGRASPSHPIGPATLSISGLPMPMAQIRRADHVHSWI
jgi:hypothetical protein